MRLLHLSILAVLLAASACGSANESEAGSAITGGDASAAEAGPPEEVTAASAAPATTTSVIPQEAVSEAPPEEATPLTHEDETAPDLPEPSAAWAAYEKERLELMAEREGRTGTAVDVWAAQTWMPQGFPGRDPATWEERLEQVCVTEFWESEPLTDLAASFMETDYRAPDGRHDPHLQSLLPGLAWAVWRMALEPEGCPDRLPDGWTYPPPVPQCTSEDERVECGEGGMAELMPDPVMSLRDIVTTGRIMQAWVGRGLTHRSIPVWHDRLQRMCAASIWEADVLESFAVEFLTEDGWGSSDEEVVRRATGAVWEMAFFPGACRHIFPAGIRNPTRPGQVVTHPPECC